MKKSLEVWLVVVVVVVSGPPATIRSNPNSYCQLFHFFPGRPIKRWTSTCVYVDIVKLFNGIQWTIWRSNVILLLSLWRLAQRYKGFNQDFPCDLTFHHLFSFSNKKQQQKLFICIYNGTATLKYTQPNVKSGEMFLEYERKSNRYYWMENGNPLLLNYWE